MKAMRGMKIVRPIIAVPPITLAAAMIIAVCALTSIRSVPARSARVRTRTVVAVVPLMLLAGMVLSIVIAAVGVCRGTHGKGQDQCGCA
jgi:hypothetical protein